MPSYNTKRRSEDDPSPLTLWKRSRINLERVKEESGISPKEEESVIIPKDENHSITVWRSKIIDEAVSQSQTELRESVDRLQRIVDNLQQDRETTCTQHEAEVQWYREHMEHLEKTVASQGDRIEELESDIIYHQAILDIKQKDIERLEAVTEKQQKEIEEMMERQNALAMVRQEGLSEIQERVMQLIENA